MMKYIFIEYLQWTHTKLGAGGAATSKSDGLCHPRAYIPPDETNFGLIIKM